MSTIEIDGPEPPTVVTVLAELNVFLDVPINPRITKGQAMREAHRRAATYVQNHYRGEEWEYLGTEGCENQDHFRIRVLFQRTDLAQDGKQWIVGDSTSAPWTAT